MYFTVIEIILKSLLLEINSLVDSLALFPSKSSGDLVDSLALFPSKSSGDLVGGGGGF